MKADKSNFTYGILFGAIAFGIHIKQGNGIVKEWKTKNIQYDLFEQLNVYWYDLSRPELFWHSFREIKNYSRDSEAIYIFKRSSVKQ